MHTYTYMDVFSVQHNWHYIIQKYQNTKKAHITEHIPNPHLLIYRLLLPYSSFLSINNHQQLICCQVKNAWCCTQTYVFVSVDKFF